MIEQFNERMGCQRARVGTDGQDPWSLRGRSQNLGVAEPPSFLPCQGEKPKSSPRASVY